MLPPVPALATTAGGFLLVLSIVLPVAGVLLAFALGDRYVRLVAFAVLPIGLAIAAAILLALPQSDGHLVYLLGLAATAWRSAACGRTVSCDDCSDGGRDFCGRHLCRV